MRPGLTNGPAPLRVLAIDAALAGCSVALVEHGAVVARRAFAGERGATAVLPGLVAAVLAESPGFDAMGVGVGPGSFTGLRAALALAHGLALGAGVPIVGVTTGEALRDACEAGGRAIWVAIDTKRGRVMLDRAGHHAIEPLDAISPPKTPILVIGDAADAVAAALGRGDADMAVHQCDAVDAAHVGFVAARRLAGELPPLPAIPFYAEPPEARLPAAARPAPRLSMLPASAVLAPVLAAVHAAAFSPRDRWDVHAMADLLAIPGVHGFADAAGGCVLLRVAADVAEILTLAVAPPCRRQGVGRSLLRRAAAAAAAAGARTMFLEVASTNAPALALYAAEGFAACGRRRGYYADGSDAVVLRRTLTPAAAADASCHPAGR